MSGVALTYRLKCGCYDWCVCASCLAGISHVLGHLWWCDIHGKTSVAAQLGARTDEAATQ